MYQPPGGQQHSTTPSPENTKQREAAAAAALRTRRPFKSHVSQLSRTVHYRITSLNNNRATTGNPQSYPRQENSKSGFSPTGWCLCWPINFRRTILQDSEMRRVLLLVTACVVVGVEIEAYRRNDDYPDYQLGVKYDEYPVSMRVWCIALSSPAAGDFSFLIWGRATSCGTRPVNLAGAGDRWRVRLPWGARLMPDESRVTLFVLSIPIQMDTYLSNINWWIKFGL